MKELWDALIVFSGAAALWIGGEVGRVIVAGGAGALVRWWASEKRTLGAGVVQTITGAVVAKFLWPLVFAITQFVLPSLEREPDTIAACAFVAGMMGISAAKIIVAIVEKFGASQRPPSNGDSDRGQP